MSSEAAKKEPSKPLGKHTPRPRDEVIKHFVEGLKNPNPDGVKEQASQKFMLALVGDLYDLIERRMTDGSMDELMTSADEGLEYDTVLARSSVVSLNMALHAVLCNWEGNTEGEAHSKVLAQHLELLRMSVGNRMDKLLELILKSSGIIPADVDVKLMDMGANKRFKTTQEFREFQEAMKKKKPPENLPSDKKLH